MGVVRVLAVHRSEYESIAERFQDSARAVLENLLRYTQQVCSLRHRAAARWGWAAVGGCRSRMPRRCMPGVQCLAGFPAA